MSLPRSWRSSASALSSFVRNLPTWKSRKRGKEMMRQSTWRKVSPEGFPFANFNSQKLKKKKCDKKKNVRCSGVKMRKNTNLGNHLAPRLISFPVIGLFLKLLNYSFPRCPVLEGKFRDYPAELVWLCILYTMQRYTKPQNKFVKTIYDTSMNDTQDDYSLRAIGQKIGHPENEKEIRKVHVSSQFYSLHPHKKLLLLPENG